MRTSETKHNPRDATNSAPVRTYTVFEDSSGNPGKTTSDNSTKDPSPEEIFKPHSAPSETPTKDPFHVTKELSSSKPRNRKIEHSIRYQTGAIRKTPTDQPSSNPRYHPISESNYL